MVQSVIFFVMSGSSIFGGLIYGSKSNLTEFCYLISFMSMTILLYIWTLVNIM